MLKTKYLHIYRKISTLKVGIADIWIINILLLNRWFDLLCVICNKKHAIKPLSTIVNFIRIEYSYRHK